LAWGSAEKAFQALAGIAAAVGRMRALGGHFGTRLARLACLAGLLLLGACDTLPHVLVFNHTGKPVRVLLYGAGERGFRLADGKGRIVMVTNTGMGLVASGCTYRYHWPNMGLNFPFEVYKDGYPVSAQLEPDLLIYILPFKTKSVAPADSFKGQQHHGFPLRPVRGPCGGAPAAGAAG
jgi:hypothetical protein